MLRKDIDSLLWVAVVALCSATACDSTSATQTTEGQNAALTNTMDDDRDGHVDESDEGMDEDEDGTVDEAHEHGDMCNKRHHDKRSSKRSDSDSGVEEDHDRSADADEDVDEGADEAGEHANQDRDHETDESAVDAAGSGGGAGGAHARQGKHNDKGTLRERIDAMDCSDVPDTAAADAGAVEAGR